MTPNKLLGLTKRMRDLFQAALAKGEEVPKLEAVFGLTEQRHLKRSFPPAVLEQVEALGEDLEEIDEAIADVESRLDLLELLGHGAQAMEKVGGQRLAAVVDDELTPGATDLPAGAGLAPDRGFAADGGGEG